MRPVRDLFGELVERRLWPIALVLVLALVAVPVLLAKSPSTTTDDGASPAPPPVATAAAAPDLPAEPIVTVATEDGPSAPLRGHAKNPFRQQHVPPDPNAGAPVSSVASDSGSGSTGPSGGGGTGGGTAPPATVERFFLASIDVRFGHAGRQLRLFEDVPPLAPLPRTQTPVVIFLGILRRDPRTTVFLVSTDVHVQGLARSACLPSRKLCQAITMRRGDVVFLDYTEPDGTVVQYELELANLDFRQSTAQEEAVNDIYVTAERMGRRLLRLAEERVARRAARRSARRARASTALRATAVTGTTPHAAALTPIP